jgi:hypothetical protein
MIVLLDRNFDDATLIGQLAATQAHLLVRLKSNRELPVLRGYPDGSYLSQIGTTPVRVVECEISIATSAGRPTGVSFKAVTTVGLTCQFRGLVPASARIRQGEGRGDARPGVWSMSASGCRRPLYVCDVCGRLRHGMRASSGPG